MIDKIYEVIANKELSFGCKVSRWDFNEIVIIGQYEIKKSKVIRIYCPDDTDYLNDVIWHPVLIGDVLDWIKIEHDLWNLDYISPIEAIINWKHKRLPIEEQSE